MIIPDITNKTALSLSVSATVAVTSIPLSVGVYAFWSTVDTYIKINTVSATADDVTVETGYKVKASDVPIGIIVNEPSFLAGIAASDGTLYYHKV